MTKLSYKINGKGRNARNIRRNMAERVLIPATGKRQRTLYMKLIYLFSLGLFSGLEAQITCLEYRMTKKSNL